MNNQNIPDQAELRASIAQLELRATGLRASIYLKTRENIKAPARPMMKTIGALTGKAVQVDGKPAMEVDEIAYLEVLQAHCAEIERKLAALPANPEKVSQSKLIPLSRFNDDGTPVKPAAQSATDKPLTIDEKCRLAAARKQEAKKADPKVVCQLLAQCAEGKMTWDECVKRVKAL